MAYIIVTTDDGAVVYKKHHSEILPVTPHAPPAIFLNELSSAVLRAEALQEEKERKGEWVARVYVGTPDGPLPTSGAVWFGERLKPLP